MASVISILTQARTATFDDLSSFAPDKTILDVFKVKYDYHNAKVLLKAEARGVEGERLLVDTGRVSPEKMQACVLTSDFHDLPGKLSQAVAHAREVLGTTANPQLCDFVLDQAYFEDMYELAQQSGSAFLKGYVRLSVDIANLKSLVRAVRMGRDAAFLKGVLFRGGNVDTDRILSAMGTGVSLEEVFSSLPSCGAGEAGAEAINGGGLTRFEKLCDDALTLYIGSARYVAFGEQPLVAYLAAKESEFTAVRIIMTGRLAGLSADVIRERLRETYV